MTDTETHTANPAEPRVDRDALFLRACRRAPVERTPVWIMRQAGRYLPEYRAVRERYDFLTCCRTPELACEITLQPVARLGVDAAILFSDILVPLPGMGVQVEFTPAPQLAQPLRREADVASLRVPDAREATPYVLEAVRLIRRQLGGRVPLIGFAGAPFTMATYLVEGGGSRSFSAIKGLLFSEPRTAHRLLGVCADTVASYLGEQVKAGAQAAMLFDTWAGLLAPDDIRTFVLPYATRVLAAVRAAAADAGAAGVPLIYYAGEAAGWLESCADMGADVIGLDWRLDLEAARARVGAGVALQGNLDPSVLLGPRRFIRQRTLDVLRAASGLTGDRARPGPAVGHIFNLGHGILPQTPPDHARVLVDSVREFSEVQP
ncbi:MAG TPA: uroporphyrinogen decarboxylase [Vicinamibacterales bacterium]|nr:uroporphyrinogen decarboxylase [Vicinamibacterales bacterium]